MTLTLNHHNANLSDVVSAMTCCAIQENVSRSFCTSHITLITTYTQQYESLRLFNMKKNVVLINIYLLECNYVFHQIDVFSLTLN